MAYPELIYLYIEDFGYCFQKQEFMLSSNYDVRYAKEGDRTLTISPKENPHQGIYGAGIANISLLVGSNGSGKTSVMELLAQPEAFAENLKRKHRERAASMGWFCVYAVDVPDRGESRQATYYLEGWNARLVSNLIGELSGTGGSYSCYFAMQGRELACFRRGGISDKLQLYYCPVSGRPFSIRRRADRGVAKRVVKQADPWSFFRFICVNRRQINETVRAENVEFSIKVDSEAYLGQASDLRGFQGTKARFLLNLHCLFVTEMESALVSEDQLIQEAALGVDAGGMGLPKDVLELYYRMLHESGYGDVPALYRYDVRMDNLSNDATPPWFRQEQSDKKKKLKRDIRRRARMLAALSQMDEGHFSSEHQVDIPAVESSLSGNVEWIFDLFKEYRREGGYREDSLDSPSIRCEYRNISEGEEAFLRLFSSVMQSVERMPKENRDVYGTRILLLDEPDLSMHPEWSRRFLSDLTRMLSRAWGKERTAYQIIVSTHSPFMISDVLKENVLCFQREQESGAIQVHPSRYGLLSNIHDIMADAFFLSSPFGALGNEVFEGKVIRKIKELESVDDPQLPAILAYVSAIGDPFIWSQVNSMLQNKLQELGGAREDNREKRIRILEEEIRLLRGDELR